MLLQHIYYPPQASDACRGSRIRPRPWSFRLHSAKTVGLVIMKLIGILETEIAPEYLFSDFWKNVKWLTFGPKTVKNGVFSAFLACPDWYSKDYQQHHLNLWYIDTYGNYPEVLFLIFKKKLKWPTFGPKICNFQHFWPVRADTAKTISSIILIFGILIHMEIIRRYFFWFKKKTQNGRLLGQKWVIFSIFGWYSKNYLQHQLNFWYTDTYGNYPEVLIFWFMIYL